MSERKYVVRLWAPVSVRVRASNRAQAVRRALKNSQGLPDLHVNREDDFPARWLESAPWKLDAADYEGGVYLAQGSAVINEDNT